MPADGVAGVHARHDLDTFQSDKFEVGIVETVIRQNLRRTQAAYELASCNNCHMVHIPGSHVVRKMNKFISIENTGWTNTNPWAVA